MPIKGFINWFAALKNKHKPLPSHVCCFSLSPHGITTAYVSRVNNAPQLQFFEHTESRNVEEVLTSLVKKYRLQKVPCVWMLDASNYQLLLMEALPVKAEEFQAAIRWRLKDMLNFPVAEAVVDSFALPLRTAEQHPMIYVVAAHLPALQPIAQQINASGLNLTAIDIPELSLRNISALYEYSEHSVALIQFQPTRSHLIITRQNTLYLSRHLDLGITIKDSDTDDNKHDLDKLILETQRSFGYYQSQWRLPAPTRILLATDMPTTMDTLNYLSEKLLASVELLDINTALANKQILDKAQQLSGLTVIGGTLGNLYATTD